MDLWVYLVEGSLEFCEIKWRKLVKFLFCKYFLVNCEFWFLFYMILDLVVGWCLGVGVFVENLLVDVLRVLEVNIFEFLVKNVNVMV